MTQPGTQPQPAVLFQSERQREILEGLNPGESVVVEGAFLLKSALSKESLGGGHEH